MKFKAHGQLRARPELAAKVRMEPLGFETAVAGSCECQISAISAHIGDVQVRAAIPFMKPRRKLPLLGTIGGFNVKLKPFHLRCGTEGIKLAGVVGVDGIGAAVDARLACDAEGDVEGNVPMKSGRIHMDLAEEESHE
jgi:hypothetical protein